MKHEVGFLSKENPYNISNELLDALRSANVDFSSYIDGSSYIFIGGTGEGKSTLINYLAGNKLVAVRSKYKKNVYKVDAPNLLGNIKIGHDTSSETKMPSKWISQDDGVTYWDCPGFCDTSGMHQDIVNAFYVNKLFNNSEKSKIVLVVSSDTIFADRIDKFLILADNVAKLGLIDSLDSVSLVVTKSETDIEVLRECFLDILKTTDSENLKKLTEFFMKHESQIALFNKPKEEGEISLENQKDIKEAIKNVTNFSHSKVNISISDKSLLFLNHLVRQMSDEFSKIFEKIDNDILSILVKKLRYSDSTKTVKNELSTLHDDVFAMFQGNKKLLYKNYEKLCNKYSLKNYSKTLSLCFDIFDFAKQIYHKNYYNLFETCNNIKSINVIKKLCTSVKSKYNVKNNELYIKSNIIDAEDIDCQIKAYSGNKLSSVNVLAFQAFYLNKNITASGLNLSIMSPIWKIKYDHTINLKGSDGKSYICRADDGYGHNGKNGVAGKNGYAGKAGEPGGSFYGYSKSVLGDGTLTINVSGGNGGKGQNGGNGSSGKNGESADSYVTKESEKLSTDLFYEDFYESVSNVIYYNQGKSGGIGGDAGKGGVGGFGASPGSIKVKNISNYKIINENGKRGASGYPGTPGEGGKYGDDFQRDYTLRKVKPGGFILTFGTGPIITTITSGWDGDSYRVSSNHKNFDGQSNSLSFSNDGLIPAKEPDKQFIKNFSNIEPDNFLYEEGPEFHVLGGSSLIDSDFI